MRGTCLVCGRKVTKGGAGRHLEACLQAQEGLPRGDSKRADSGRALRVRVEGRDEPAYWMYMELPAKRTLQDLDDFLRDTWLECCGHLSSFRVGEELFDRFLQDAAEWGVRARSMAVRVGRVLRPGLRFAYEYDFGTTTELVGTVVSEGPARSAGARERALARNDPPSIRCARCGKEAVRVCPECRYETKGWFCESHAAAHHCGAEVFLPVVNSPRVGLCAYAGPRSSGWSVS